MKIDTREEKARVYDDVLYLLKEYPQLRKSDNALFVKYCEINMMESDPKYNPCVVGRVGSVTRARRKVQEDFPELRDEETADTRDWERVCYQEVFAD